MRNSLRLSLLFILFFCLCYSKLYAQKEAAFFETEKTISMDFQDASLKSIIKVFSIQSGLNFIASEAVQDRKISLYMDKVSIKEAMDKIFKANNLTYDLDEEANIFIVKDWGKAELETITRVYQLKYRSVPSANLEKEKKSLLKDSNGASAEAPAVNTEGGGGVDIVASLKQVLSKEGKIGEDIRTNSLIITDAPNRFAGVERVIAALDVPQAQVMLDVEILDVSKNVIDKLGFEFGDNPITLLLPNKGPEFFIGDVANKFAKEITASRQGSLILRQSYSHLFDFLRTKTDTRFLARPKLLTLNNETAEISITKDEIVGKKVTVETSASGSTSTEDFTRSTDLKLTPEGTGVFLRVTPQINPETNEIIMVINPKSSTTTLSSLSSTTNLQSDVEVRSTKSIVKVKDGETVILGGLIHNDKSVETKKIPILGDIPLLGALFRSKNQEKDKERELLVFITPHIVKEANFGQLAQAKKPVLPEREQDVVLGASRKEEIKDYLDNFDKEGK